MGKHEALTPKAIANRIKAKGLQKTRWYCEMCKKQCRDANGFKCHTESEAHQRQMVLFSQNAGKITDEFSGDFEAGMMDIIKRRYRNKRVLANVVYNEYISDRHHVHMNATRWVTLTGFVLYLGKSGKCKVEDTPKGWYISYIERDPEVLEKQARAERKEKMELDDAERAMKEVERRAKNATQQEVPLEKPTDLQRSEGNEEAAPIKFALTKMTKITNANPTVTTPKATEEETKESHSEEDTISVEPKERKEIKKEVKVDQPVIDLPAKSEAFKEESGAKEDRKRKISALEDIMMQEERKKDKINRKDYWLTEGIVVKVLNKKLADGKYYKQKAVVKKVLDTYIGLVKIVDGSDVLKIDQEQLETVIPAVGGRVKIVNGAYRGFEGTLLGIDVDNFVAKVKVETGPHVGTVFQADYQDICKIHSKIK